MVADYFYAHQVKQTFTHSSVAVLHLPCHTTILSTGVCSEHLLGDVGEFAPPSEEVVVAFDSAGRVGLGREDGGGAREGAGPVGANI